MYRCEETVHPCWQSPPLHPHPLLRPRASLGDKLGTVTLADNTDVARVDCGVNCEQEVAALKVVSLVVAVRSAVWLTSRAMDAVACGTDVPAGAVCNDADDALRFHCIPDIAAAVHTEFCNACAHRLKDSYLHPHRTLPGHHETGWFQRVIADHYCHAQIAGDAYGGVGMRAFQCSCCGAVVHLPRVLVDTNPPHTPRRIHEAAADTDTDSDSSDAARYHHQDREVASDDHIGLDDTVALSQMAGHDDNHLDDRSLDSGEAVDADYCYVDRHYSRF